MIALYFEFENVLKFYNLEVRCLFDPRAQYRSKLFAKIISKDISDHWWGKRVRYGVVLFVLMLYIPNNTFSVMIERVCPG